MEYSVGSLADLISGQQTSNKPKVVQKKFVPIKKEPVENTSEPIQKRKKFIKTEPVDATESKFSKKGGKLKFKSSFKAKNKLNEGGKFKKGAKQNVFTTNDDSDQKSKSNFPRKPKNKQNKIKTNDDSEPSSEQISKSNSPKKPKNKQNISITNDDSDQKSKNNTPKKPKNKRKLNDSEIDVADSDADESSPKKQKLSRELSVNEQNAAGRIKNKKNQDNKNSSEYKDRTLFVGNIPITIKKKQIKSHFQKYGPIDTIRIRGIAVADPKTSKKLAAIKKEFHPDRKTVYCFIRFNKAEDAKKAEVENGALFMEHHIRVSYCESEDKPDEAKAIFVGNLPFNVEDEELWNLFKPCGPISHIRVIRDGRTGMGRGFGYVNFQDGDGSQLALEMGTVKLRDRELRISACDNGRAQKKKIGKKPRHRNQRVKNGDNGKEAIGEGVEKKIKSEGAEKKIKSGKPEAKEAFGGTKFTDKKKKRKFSKALNDKKTLAQKLTAPGPKPQDS